MRVRFLQDFQGVLTQERFFRAGEEEEFDDQLARDLIADGRAESTSAGNAENGDAGQPKRKRAA